MSIQGQDPDLVLYNKAITQAEHLFPISITTLETIETRTIKVGLDVIRAFDPTTSSKEAKKLAESLRDKMSIKTQHDFTILLKAASDFLLILDEVQPFHIEPPPSLTLVNGAPKAAPYTVLSQCSRSVSDVHRMVTTFPKIPIRELIALKPERLVLHEMVAKLVLEVSLTESEMDQEIARLSQALAEEFLAQNPNFSRQLLKERAVLEETILQYLDDDSTKIAPNIKQLVDSAKSGISLDPDKKIAVAHYVADLVYQQKLQAELKNYPIFNSPVLRGYNPLPAQLNEDRRLIMVNGGIASGKGTTEDVIKKKIETDGVSWNSVAKLNTDSFKRTLLDPAKLDKEHFYFYSRLVHDEASMLENRIFSEFQQRVKDNTAPHLYMDQVLPRIEKLNLSASSSRGLDLYLVQIPVEKSVQMAYKSGEKIGRFETTKDILSSHQQVPLQFQSNIKTAVKAGARNIRVHFMANVSVGVVKEAATFDFQKRTQDIPEDGKEYLVGFYKKTKLNTDAKTMEELYPVPFNEEKHAEQMINELIAL